MIPLQDLPANRSPASLTAGSFLEPGAATAWMRMSVPLVAGEEITPLRWVLTAADSGNGVSVALDFHRYVFINADFIVGLYRSPVGEWVCLDARSVVDGAGIGLAGTVLHDERGQLARRLTPCTWSCAAVTACGATSAHR
ncbi:hypothetical protein ACFV2N_28555 [Streptomyces sp. NPDC059680]|uniref:hypothetical protein n=1 Tax=Streptomyces sp. NPDC059680 TaxID=3346904 RepID=UPI00367EE773